mmetsp:Transcript_42956/g.124218  ORF Transcript_42956/g.124218 Transcript_42956/m.124218 type:complete len:284 (-) Transcript_42956:249-1100(-)
MGGSQGCCCKDGKDTEIAIGPGEPGQRTTYPSASGGEDEQWADDGQNWDDEGGDKWGENDYNEEDWYWYGDEEEWAEEDWVAVEQAGFAACEDAQQQANLEPTSSSQAKPQPTEDPLDAESPRDEDEEVKAETRQRVQAAVSAFVKRAVKGIPCKAWDDESSEWKACEYKLDRHLEKINFVIQGTRTSQAVCRVAAIEDIYTHESDGEAAFPPAALKTLTPEERDVMAMLIGVAATGQAAFRILLLESTKDSLSAMMESMRVLVVYARAKSGPPAPPGRSAAP